MIGPLRSVWNAPPASPAPPRRVWRDWALVGVLFPLVVIEAALRPEVPWLLFWVIVTAGPVLTLLWRRTRPLAMFLIAFGVAGVAALVAGRDGPLYTAVYGLVLVYSVFRWGSGRARVVAVAVMVATLVMSAFIGPMVVADVVGSFAIVGLTIALALVFRYRASLRMRELDRAKSREREELARDLHDTVAHHVSAIAIQAQGGLATVGTDPAAAENALRVIEAEASRALAEMRSIVRVLRQDAAAELAPVPRVADLRELAGGGRDGRGGPAVEVRFVGDVDSLPGPAAAAVYRIAQESVTNARRHARHASRIDVLVEADAARVRLTVHDDGQDAVIGEPGYGITGMVERATLLGGTCTAGPDPAGGWTVTANLPRKGWAA